MTSSRTKLILTTSPSGAGHLKMASVADAIFFLDHRLVWGAAPAPPDPADVFAARRRLASMDGGDWAYWTEWEAAVDEDEEEQGPGLGAGPAALRRFDEQSWVGLADLAARFDRLELWIDPDPNDQLVLLQLLDRLAGLPDVAARCALVHAATRLAERRADDAATLGAEPESVGEAHLVLGRRGWAAFTHTTPEPWAGLLEAQTQALPHLRATVLEMLQELPAADTALGATEMRLLELIAPGGVRPFDAFPGHLKANTQRVFGYWETGRLLDRLAAEPGAAIVGLDEGPFTLALNDARERRARYSASRLSLSPLGERLVQRRDDLARHRPIARWWGGVKLTPDALWRWDDAGRRLVAPGERAGP